MAFVCHKRYSWENINGTLETGIDDVGYIFSTSTFCFMSVHSLSLSLFGWRSMRGRVKICMACNYSTKIK